MPRSAKLFRTWNNPPPPLISGFIFRERFNLALTAAYWRFYFRERYNLALTAAYWRFYFRERFNLA